MMNASLFTPDYSHLTGLLQHLNDEELKELLNNDGKLKALVHDLKQVHDIEAEREMLLTSNKSISEYNLSKKPILEEHRRQVEETRRIAIELKDSLTEKKRKIESKQKATNNETLLALLQAATSEKEEEAEAAVEMFLQNEIAVEEFLPKYLEMRKLAHLRRIKAEKLANIIHETNSNSVTPPSRPERPKRNPPSANTGGQNNNNNNTPMPARPAPYPPASHPFGAGNPYPMGPYQQNPFGFPPPPQGPNYNPYANPYVPRYPTYK